MNGLTVTNLHRAFQKVEVLQGVNLEVPQGTLTAVLGASGSGKTTLLRIIAGFERAGSGEVAVDDMVVESQNAFVPPERRNIGYVSQDGSLFPHLSVWNNVAFGLPRNERKGPKVAELLDLVGLSGLDKRLPHQLSGGEQQRVALARALAPRPRLVLLDEPFSALDATLRVSLRSDVRKVLRESGVSAVLVTHDQDEALSLADQVSILRNGTIVQTGTPRHIYEKPVDPDVARFIGNVNLVDAVFEKGKARTALGVLAIAKTDFSFGDGSSIVIVLRPEQIVPLATTEGPGLPAIIVHCEYFGHDAIMTARPTEMPAESDLVVRVPGLEALSPGTRVRLTSKGKVLAWPRDSGKH